MRSTASHFFYSDVTTNSSLQRPLNPLSSIHQVCSEIGNLACLHLLAPVVQITSVHFPKLSAKLEVLQDDVLLAFFQEVFGETHVGAEAVHLRRTFAVG